MRNDIPNDSASNFGARVRETLMTYLGKQGDPLDRGVTLRDLVDSGFAAIGNLRLGTGNNNTAALIPGTAITDAYTKDLTPPPIPTGFKASSGITTLLIECDAPKYTQGHGHLRSHVYGATREGTAPNPVFADAIEITQFSGTVTSYSTNPATEWHLWLKWESVDGVLSVSPAGGTNGVVVTTGQDVAKLLTALTGKLKSEQLYTDLNSRINLIDTPTTGLVDKVSGLVTTYGSTAAAATSASNAVIAEAAAVAAKVAAIAAQTGAETASSTATTSATNAGNSASAAATSATTAATSATNAGTSAGAASTSATTASTKAGEASTSANNAATSATNAAGSASSASTSATTAATSATNAGNSASAAATSATTASTKATDASTSATAASTSATTASTKAGEASTSATNAATSATNAAGSATSASTSATTAATSATNAGNSAAAASTSATNASTYATNAGTAAAASSTSATTAATSAGSAGTYASNAATSATNAAGSATSAATALTQVQASNATALAAVQTLATTTAGPDGLTAQYTVKTDVNGYVSGYGLSSTSNTAGATSTFAVRADAFYIASPVDSPVTAVPTAATTPAWSSTTTYTTNDLVSYADNVYYSRVSSNKNHLPYISSYWSKIRQPIKTLPTAAAWSSTSSYAINAVVSYGGFVWEAQLPLSASTVPPSTSTTNWYKLTVTPEKFLPFIVRTTPTTIDGVVVRPGVYIADGYIQNGTITNAKIGMAEIDDAKISSLSADKIIAGTIQVGNYIQSTSYIPGSSGWYIDGDGNAEFGAASIRGTLIAAQIDAGAIDATKLSSITIESSKNIKVGDAAVSQNTITGSGAVFNGNGTFALGNSTANISYNGTIMTLNGNIVGTGNIYLNSVTTTTSVDLISDVNTTSSSYISILSTGIIESTGGQPMMVYFSMGAYHTSYGGRSTASLKISVHDGTSISSGYGTESAYRIIYLQPNIYSSQFGMAYFPTTPTTAFKVDMLARIEGQQASGENLHVYAQAVGGANPAVATYMNVLVTKR